MGFSSCDPILPKLMAKVSNCRLFRNTRLFAIRELVEISGIDNLFTFRLFDKNMELSSHLDDVPAVACDAFDARTVQTDQLFDTAFGGERLEVGLPLENLGEFVDDAGHVGIGGHIEFMEVLFEFRISGVYARQGEVGPEGRAEVVDELPGLGYRCVDGVGRICGGNLDGESLRVRLERYQGLIASPFNRVGREPGT